MKTTNVEPSQGQFSALIALYNQGKLEQALDEGKALEKQFPSTAYIPNLLGIVNASLGRLEQAVASYEKALAINPGYADAYNNMGSVLKEKGETDAAIECYEKALKINPNYADAYNNMGNALTKNGKPNAAIECYKNALKIKPGLAAAHNNMGIILQGKGEPDAAIECYKKALAINPNYESPKHLLAALTGSTTESAPRAYVESLFDGYAIKFDTSLVKELDYNIPKSLSKIILTYKTESSLGSILDLGCGTGLAGVELRDSSRNLEGIDVSSAMLEQARQKNVYDRLTHTDLIEYLSTADLDFDYFVATDVFIYVGSLYDVFRLIKSRNRRAGMLAFSTEHTDKEGFSLETSGRYSHSKSYIEELCEKFEYKISHFSTTNLRKEKDGYLTGGLYLLDFTPEV